MSQKKRLSQSFRRERIYLSNWYWSWWEIGDKRRISVQSTTRRATICFLWPTSVFSILWIGILSISSLMTWIKGRRGCSTNAWRSFFPYFYSLPGGYIIAFQLFISRNNLFYGLWPVRSGFHLSRMLPASIPSTRCPWSTRKASCGFCLSRDSSDQIRFKRIVAETRPIYFSSFPGVRGKPK
jgi:hypothetical protein